MISSLTVHIFYINFNLKVQNTIQYSVSSIAENDMTSSGSGYELHFTNPLILIGRKKRNIQKGKRRTIKKNNIIVFSLRLPVFRCRILSVCMFELAHQHLSAELCRLSSRSFVPCFFVVTFHCQVLSIPCINQKIKNNQVSGRYCGICSEERRGVTETSLQMPLNNQCSKKY